MLFNRYRLAISASVWASVIIGLNFEGCGDDGPDDDVTPAPGTDPNAGNGTDPDGPNPAPSPIPGPSPGPNPGPAPGPTPDPFGPLRWNCREWDTAGGFGCGALSEKECEAASVVSHAHKTASGKDESACWNDFQGQKVGRHGRGNSCTVRYCWAMTSKEGCHAIEDCMWDPDFKPTKYGNPDNRREGSHCYSCSMQGKSGVEEHELPRGCPNRKTYPGITREFYKEMVGYVWRSCGPEGMNREMPTFPGMNFEMLDGVDPTMTTNMITDASNSRFTATPRKSHTTMSTEFDDDEYHNSRSRHVAYRD